jgi:hypothetical protein
MPGRMRAIDFQPVQTYPNKANKVMISSFCNWSEGLAIWGPIKVVVRSFDFGSPFLLIE